MEYISVNLLVHGQLYIYMICQTSSSQTSIVTIMNMILLIRWKKILNNFFSTYYVGEKVCCITVFSQWSWSCTDPNYENKFSDSQERHLRKHCERNQERKITVNHCRASSQSSNQLRYRALPVQGNVSCQRFK